MSNFNQDHIFSKAEKIYMLCCGLIIAGCMIWVTYAYFEYRVINGVWQTTFVSPKEFWKDIPEVKWKPVLEEFKG